jgi:hypothetical protein
VYLGGPAPLGHASEHLRSRLAVGGPAHPGGRGAAAHPSSVRSLAKARHAY